MWLTAQRISNVLGSYISIGGASGSCPSGMGYRLRVGKRIQRYTNEQAAHESIYMNNVPTITEEIPNTGYPCVPGAIYVVDSMERGVNSIYNIMLAATEEGILRGINVLGSGMLVPNGYNCKVVISVVQPVMIKPNEFYAKLQFHQDPQQPAREHCCTGYGLCEGRVFGYVSPLN